MCPAGIRLVRREGGEAGGEESSSRRHAHIWRHVTDANANGTVAKNKG